MNSLKTYRKKFESIFLRIHGEIDQRRLSKKIHFFTKYNEDILEAYKIIEPIYKIYIKNVSTKEMSCSLELALFLFHLCVQLRLNNILDLGSGFSSYIFRKYLQIYNAEGQIVSVDDNIEWLNKTKNFLEEHKISIPSLLTYDDYVTLIQNQRYNFDLVFFDFGNMKVRIELLNDLLISNKTSIIVFDDMHKKSYRKKVIGKLKQINTNYYSLYCYTHDEFDRFSYIYIPD